MTKLEFLTVRGFRSLAELQRVRLGSVNVLIGANGSGKSNSLAVFALLHAIRDGRLDEYVRRVGGAERLLHFGSKSTKFIEVALEFSRNRRYQVKLKPTIDDDLFVAEEAAAGLEKENDKDDGKNTVRAWIERQLNSWRIYHFQDTGDSSPIKKTSNLHDNRFLRADAANLAAFLYLLRQRYPQSYSLIKRTIRVVAPFFDDFHLEPHEANQDMLRLEWRHVGTDTYFDSGSLSDGTLRFMALATLLLQPVQLRPSIIIVDEPEIGMHPMAVSMLSGMIKQAAVDTQVIVSTQSPQLLDHFEPEDVLVADRERGSTKLSRLDADRLEEWLEDYSLGQLWEKIELGGWPSAA